MIDLDSLLLQQSKKGNLNNVIYLIGRGANNLNQALLITESINIMCYLIKKGANNIEQVFLMNAEFGNLNIIKYLSKYIKNTTVLNKAMLSSLRNNNILVFKYLIEHGADVHTETDFAIRFSAGNGYLQLVRYLVFKKANINAFNGQALVLATENKHKNVVDFLKKIRI